MSARVFVDTKMLAESGLGAVSTKVLSEFFSVVTRRLRPRLPLDTALVELERHARVWALLNVTAPMVIAAARAVRDHSLSFWDAQLWAAAKLNELDTILSEDFQAGARLGGVRFVNPFAADFRPAQWLA